MKNIYIILISLTFLISQYDWDANGIPVRQGVHIEWQRTGDSGDTDEMIYAWSDTRSGGRDIYVQKIDSNGNLLWGSEGTPIVVAEGRQEDPILVKDGNGGAYIIWVDYRDEPDNGDIYGQHISSDGQISWGITGVALTNVPGKQVSPNMCYDGQGGAFVIWNDLSVSTLGHVYGTHLTLNSDDIISQGVGVPLISNNSQHSGVSIETAAPGSAVMVWADDRNIDSTDIDVYTQRIDANCNTIWSTPEDGGIPLCQEVGTQEYAKVTYYSDEYSVIAWEDRRENAFVSDIYVQYIDMDGNLQLSLGGEAICTNPAPQIKPRIKASPTGTFIVWEDNRNGAGDIYVQKHVLGEGTQLAEDGLGVCNAMGQQDQPRLTTDGLGGAYIVWMDERYGSFPETEIFMQHVNDVGDISFELDGIAVCDEQGFQFNPLVRNDGNGNAFAVWGDMRSGSIGLYTQHLNPNTGVNLEDNGLELYFGIDGNGLQASSLYLGNDETLIYWEDKRLGIFADLTYGQKVYNGWENVVESNGYKLSNNNYQVNPKAETIADNVFMGFGQAYGDIVLHYQILDNNLQMQGDSEGTPVFESFTPQNEYDLANTDSDNVVFAFSDQRNFIDNDIYIQKFDASGVPFYSEPVLVVDNFFVDDNIKFVNVYDNEQCFIAYDSGDFTGTRAMITSTDDDGSIMDGWSTGERLSDYESDQFIRGMVEISDGYFIIWKDQRSGSADIYGQAVDWDGNMLGDQFGIPIAVGLNDQQSPSMTYNLERNEIMVCWEDFINGTDFDIYCAVIDGSTYAVSENIDLCTYSGNQKTPDVYATIDGTYLFAWEDSRGGVTTDLYYQSMTNGMFDYTDNGIELCNAQFNQFNPKIDIYSETDNSYIIYWDDMRSSGKEDLKNIYAQSVTIASAQCVSMDLNNDGIVNVIDIVSLVNVVLGTEPPTDMQLCAGDVNGDGVLNVIDIVNIVNFILS